MNRNNPYWENFWPFNTVSDTRQGCGYPPEPRRLSADRLVFDGQSFCLQSPVTSSDPASAPSDCHLTPQYRLEGVSNPEAGLFLGLFEARGDSFTLNISSKVTKNCDY